ncbi:MAG: ATP-binding cassette domain-containing protein [Bacteroidetes bacterium]|nr:ATP-binding cassette domain-containing protein [Bacteroidota bacterium]
MIEIKELNKSFGDKHVLKNINTSFYPGNVNVVIGASGSGKSVLMKCMVGLVIPDEGEILYNGQDFVDIDYKKKKDIRKQIGMLFQGSALFDSLSVEENIEFPLKMFSDMSQEERLDRVNFCLQRVKLENANNLFPSEISGGMKKRVGIARAIALNPKYLFCDEPNSGLDPVTSRVIDTLIEELTEEYNITTIMNSHDMKTLFDIGDHVTFIYKGDCAFAGNIEDFRNSDMKEIEEFLSASYFKR